MREAERVDYPDDTIWLRAAGHGDIQAADYGFARDMARLFAAGAAWDEVVAVADQHGIKLG